MPARLPIILLLPLLGLAGCASAPAGAEAQRQVTVIQGDFPAVANGMSADAVRQQLGDPAEIQPGRSNEASSEVWVYYFAKDLGRTEVVNFVNRPALSGAFENDPFVMIPEPVYRQVDRKLLVTLRLLMIDGRLASQTTRSKLSLGT